MMTVKEIKKELKKYSDNDIVVLSSDSEGNGYSPLCDIEDGKYNDREVYIKELTPELIRRGYTVDDLCEDGVDCIILYPV